MRVVCDEMIKTGRLLMEVAGGGEGLEGSG